MSSEVDDHLRMKKLLKQLAARHKTLKLKYAAEISNTETTTAQLEEKDRQILLLTQQLQESSSGGSTTPPTATTSSTSTTSSSQPQHPHVDSLSLQLEKTTALLAAQHETNRQLLESASKQKKSIKRLTDRSKSLQKSLKTVVAKRASLLTCFKPRP